MRKRHSLLTVLVLAVALAGMAGPTTARLIAVHGLYKDGVEVVVGCFCGWLANWIVWNWGKKRDD